MENNTKRCIYTDAILGVSVNYNDGEKLPKSICSFDSEMGTWRVKKDALEKFNDDELEALYFLLKNREVFNILYCDFEPISDEESEYNNKRDVYVERMRKKKKDNGEIYTNSDEIADNINFSILHDMAVHDKKFAEKLCKAGTLSEKCVISKDKMEELAEERKKVHLDVSITFVAMKLRHNELVSSLLK